MKRDTVSIPAIKSSFLSCDKDLELIINKLFTSSQPHSDLLKRLLVINAPDALSNTDSDVYKEAIKNATVANLVKNGYVRFSNKVRFPEQEEIKSYLLIWFNNFTPNVTNPQFRDCNIVIDIVCHADYWWMEDYQLRPFKIAGYIDGILNESKLTGIGTLNFVSAQFTPLDENVHVLCLTYRAVHGSDDIIPPKED